MRHPLNPGYRITTNFSLSHPGTDYAPPTKGQTGVPCFAPEHSKVVRSAYKPALEGHYVMLEGLDTGKFYYFGHFAERRVSVGQTINEGTVIGILGMTGAATGIHTHCEVRDTLTTGKHNPEAWFQAHITKPSSGGNEVFNNIEEVKEAYMQMRGQVGTDAEMRPWIGQSKQRWIQMSKAETDSTRQQLAEVRQALLNEQAKPAKEIIKEVVKIVDRPVEVIKEVEVVKEVEPSWLVAVRDFILSFLKLKK